MKKFQELSRWLMVSGILSLLTIGAHAAPTIVNVQNQGGVLLVDWADNGDDDAGGYRVYRATFSTTKANMAILGVTVPNDSDYLDTASLTENQTYCYLVTSVSAAGAENGGDSNVLCGIPSQLPTTGSVSFTGSDNVIGTDTESVTFTYTLDFIVAKKITLDIIDDVTNASVFTGGIITQNSTTVGPITWNGLWTKSGEAGNKHNGSYTIRVTVEPYMGDIETIDEASIGVDVVHINGAAGTNTVTLKNIELGTNPPGQGPPFQLTYRLTKPAFLLAEIRNRSSGALIKTITNYAPRQEEFASRDKENTELWDGRDDLGNLIQNDIYYFNLQAAEEINDTDPRSVSVGTDTSTVRTADFAFDVIRLLDVAATAITATASSSNISYTLTMDATVQIKIAEPGTTFTISSGTLVPSNTANVVKTFNFGRKQGAQTEVWNGQDESANYVANDIYVVAIAAFNNGITAIDSNGNDRPILTQITVDRTQSQTTCSDTTAPTLTSITVGSTALSTGGGTNVNTAFSTMTTVLTDNSGGSGVSSNTSIILTDPNNATVTLGDSFTSSGLTGTVVSTFTAQSTQGTYSAQVTPRDTCGTAGQTQTVTFTYNPSASSGGGTSVAATPFADTVYAYPNPATSAPARIAYTLTATSNVRFEFFNMLGEKVFEETLTSQSANAYTATSGANAAYSWNLVNAGAEKVGSGLYLVRVSATDTSSGAVSKTTKKLVIVR